MKPGDSFSREFVVDAAVYDGFITTFKDRNPLHYEENFAKAHGFKSRVMHGNILNGFLSYFIGECLPVKNMMIYAQEIKFIKPVYLGDRLLFEAKISHIIESVNVVDFKYTFANQDGVRVAKGKVQIGLLRQ